MKFNNIKISLCAVTALALGFSSCIEDESVYGDVAALPTISVNTGAIEGDIPEVNNYIGSETVINPQIRYDGTAPLSYSWYIDDGVVLSTEPVFRFRFPTGGEWNVNLTVTDGTVGFTQAYKVNVNRPFESGYCLVSNTADGKGNLVFLKDMTAEEIEEGIDPIVLEDCIQRVVSDAIDEPLIGVQLVKPSWPPTAKGRFMVSTASRCYFLEPNTFTRLADLQYGADFSATDLLPFAAECVALDSKVRRAFTLKSEDMLAVEETAWKGQAFDTYVVNAYENWGSMNYDIAYINTDPLVVHNRMYDYNVGGYAFGQNDELAGDEYLASGTGQKKTSIINDPVYGSYEVTDNSVYFITRGKNDGKLYWCYMTGFDAYASDAPQMAMRKLVGDASSAAPAPGSSIVSTYDYNRSYYYNGNHVYTMVEGTDGINTLPSTSQWSLEYPDNEEVTFISIDNGSLIVATADKTTGRGNVYFYDPRNVRTDNPGETPSKQYLNCADRISQIFYKKRI